MLARVVVAAAGAGVPVAIVAALAARSRQRSSFPGARLTVGADAASAAVWAGVLAAVGAGAGAAMEGARGRTSADVLRGGVAAYLWALGLLVIGVLVVATLEPQATRAYVDGLEASDRPGPPSSARTSSRSRPRARCCSCPASGSCIDLVAAGSVAARLCPWTLEATRYRRGCDPSPPVRLARALADGLGPGCGSAVGGVPRWASGGCISGAAIRGRARGRVGRRLRGDRDARGGVRLTRIVVPSLAGWLRLEISVWSWRTAGLLCLWGVIGGAIGGWLAGRAYEAPGPRDRPRRRSPRSP